MCVVGWGRGEGGGRGARRPAARKAHSLDRRCNPPRSVHARPAHQPFLGVATRVCEKGVCVNPATPELTTPPVRLLPQPPACDTAFRRGL